MQNLHGVTILVWGDEPEALRTRLTAERVLGGEGFHLVSVRAVPPDRVSWDRAVGEAGAGAVLTVGGAGFPAGEIVPEVSGPLVVRPVPGLPEAIREAGRAFTPLAALFRGTAGLTSDGRLLVNLPGEGPWLEASLRILAGVLGHALDKAGGDPRDCGRAL